MDREDWKGVLGAVAPTIAHVLGGPLAGTAVGELSKKLLGKKKATEQEIAEVIQEADPETLAKLRQIDAEFKVAMKNAGVDLRRIDLENTQGARELAQVDMRPQAKMSYLFITGYFTILVLSAVVPDFKIDPLLLGVLTVGIPIILNFWFGSSSGSKESKALAVQAARIQSR